MKNATTKKEEAKKGYQVYTFCDGNLDGATYPMTLEEAKALAEVYYQDLLSFGESDTRVHVLEFGSGNFVWGLGDKN